MNDRAPRTPETANPPDTRSGSTNPDSPDSPERKTIMNGKSLIIDDLRKSYGDLRVLDGMSPQAVGIAVRRAAEAAGIPGERVTAHGLRAGLATEARRAGHDVTTIAKQGRWSPSGAAIHGYMRVVDQWSDNAVRGIGL